jgi:hypothetical protein
MQSAFQCYARLAYAHLLRCHPSHCSHIIIFDSSSLLWLRLPSLLHQRLAVVVVVVGSRHHQAVLRHRHFVAAVFVIAVVSVVMLTVGARTAM